MFFKIILIFLLCSNWQTTKGSPVNPALHVHMGLWFMVWQRAFTPHVPEQGSLHLCFIQAWCCGQSVLITHSGLQAGGDPMDPSSQEQTPCPFNSLHWL